MTTTYEPAVLHPLDGPGATLADLVAAQLDTEHAVPTHVSVDEVPYDLPSLTTAGRHVVRGHALVAGAEREFGFFVKHVRTAAHAPLLRGLPAAVRAEVAEALPWRTEPEVYSSDLADRLPSGLRMPRCFAIAEQHDSAVLWLELVDVAPARWSVSELAQAAYLLGRVGASQAVRPLAVAESLPSLAARQYVDGRAARQLLPVLDDPATWRHPLATAFLPLRGRLQAEIARLEDHLQVLESTAVGAAHGDAAPNNLLRSVSHPDLVMIDFGLWSAQPLGHDLGQLIIGDVQIGRSPAAGLAVRDEACRSAYLHGVRDEGVTLSGRDLLAAHASQLLIFTGLSLLPTDLLDTHPDARDLALAAQRAAALAFVLDLVETARERR